MPISPQHRFLVLCALVFPCLVAVSPARGQEGSSESYRLGPKDLIRIRVFEAPEFDTEARVSEGGTIKLPVAGEIDVSGLSDAQLAQRLEERLEECCVRSASVAVQVLEFFSRPITVIGAVSRPGPLPFSGGWTLLEAITAAGGLASSHGDVVHILRRADNGLSDQLTVRIDDLLMQGDRRANVPLLANDLVNVPAAVEVTVFCLGEVNRPGSYSFKSTERITVLTTIAKAGGLTDRAASKILIKRQGGEELEVDYKRIISGRSPDVEVETGDVLLVKESFF